MASSTIIRYLDSLPRDVLVHVMSYIDDASSLRAMFACAHDFEALRRCDHLRMRWLETRTSAGAVALLTKAVTDNRLDQVGMLLVPSILVKFTTTELASALLLAMRMRHSVMYCLIPLCSMTVHRDDELQLIRVLGERDTSYGFSTLLFRVYGLDSAPTDPPSVFPTLAFSCLDTVVSNRKLRTSTFTCFERRVVNNVPATFDNGDNRVVTILLGGPTTLSPPPTMSSRPSISVSPTPLSLSPKPITLSLTPIPPPRTHVDKILLMNRKLVVMFSVVGW